MINKKTFRWIFVLAIIVVIIGIGLFFYCDTEIWEGKLVYTKEEGFWELVEPAPIKEKTKGKREPLSFEEFMNQKLAKEKSKQESKKVTKQKEITWGSGKLVIKKKLGRRPQAFLIMDRKPIWIKSTKIELSGILIEATYGYGLKALRLCLILTRSEDGRFLRGDWQLYSDSEFWIGVEDEEFLEGSAVFERK